MNIYYLKVEEIQHYKYMLNNGYDSEVIKLPSQKYLVFPIVNKPSIAIAWPTVTGTIDCESKKTDTLLIPNKVLAKDIIKNLQTLNIKGILFPRYADK